jgi:hypothetical protein
VPRLLAAPPGPATPVPLHSHPWSPLPARLAPPASPPRAAQPTSAFNRVFADQCPAPVAPCAPAGRPSAALSLHSRALLVFCRPLGTVRSRVMQCLLPERCVVSLSCTKRLLCKGPSESVWCSNVSNFAVRIRLFKCSCHPCLRERRGRRGTYSRRRHLTLSCGAATGACSTHPFIFVIAHTRYLVHLHLATADAPTWTVLSHWAAGLPFTVSPGLIVSPYDS